jgi:CheY-like chemotaxis protein
LATQQRLFRAFTQADESTTRQFGGTGLGLSICRELATLMGGTVGVQSEPGIGSLFWTELPLPTSTAVVAGPPPPAPDCAALKGRLVLMVEDNPVNMLIAVALLERWGVVVEQAGDGRQALEAVQRAARAGRPFDAVLMDVQMPLMSGYEATRAMRRAGVQLPVIALTAAALVSERKAAMEAGMDDFLTKPIDADKLRDTLSRWVARP